MTRGTLIFDRPATVDFPEAELPPPAEFRAQYEHYLEVGLARMRERRVVLCGLARDVAPVLPVTIARMERLGQMFADYRVVIYENDSADNSREMLFAWSHRNPRVTVRSERRGAPVNPNARCLKRSTRMAYYRNSYREYIAEHFADFDHTIVVDTDLVGGWSYDGVANSFGHDNWDFIGSNGIIYRATRRDPNLPVQFDAWAFRLDRSLTPLSTAEVNSMYWHRGAPLVPVTSCFGGLGIYPQRAMIECRYDDWDIEHVPLHRDMAERGMDRMFLNPSQITLYGRRRRKSDRLLQPYFAVLARCTGREEYQWR